MDKKPIILDSNIVAESQFFKIENIHLKFSNGNERNFERIAGRARGSVMIVPLLNLNTILLIREYSAGVDQYVLGFPKGAVEHGEDLMATANRELKEEVGYGAKSLMHLGRFSASPGYLTSMMEVVLATELFPKKEIGDEPEPITVHPWNLEAVDALINHPEFHEARSIAALWMLKRHLDD